MSTLRPLLASLCLGLFSVAALAQATEEVPFVTSPDNVTLEMLRIADVGPTDHVIDLGSGDGRIVILAAKRFGASGLGVEIVPDLVRQSQRNAQDAGVAARVEFREQDLFRTAVFAGASVRLARSLRLDLTMTVRTVDFDSPVGTEWSWQRYGTLQLRWIDP